MYPSSVPWKSQHGFTSELRMMTKALHTHDREGGGGGGEYTWERLTNQGLQKAFPFFGIACIRTNRWRGGGDLGNTRLFLTPDPNLLLYLYTLGGVGSFSRESGKERMVFSMSNLLVGLILRWDGGGWWVRMNGGEGRWLPPRDQSSKSLWESKCG